MTSGYEQLRERLVDWALTEDNLRAVVMLGSRARADHPADDWADLDLLLIAVDIQLYLEQARWVAQIGNSWLTFIEASGDGRTLERRVLFSGGLDVDLAFLPAEIARGLLEPGAAPAALDVFRRGARVLVDKDDWAARILAAVRAPAPPAVLPSEDEFLNLVSDFWYHAVWTAKHLRRGELWWAKAGCDEHLKSSLRRMLEWQARAAHGAGHDTWLRGRFLEEWADPRAVAQLPGAFAHYDAEDVWRALLVTMDLFRWVSQETAQRLSFSCATTGAACAAELVQHLAAGKKLNAETQRAFPPWGG